MVLGNMGLVHMVARRYESRYSLRWAEYEDLVQEGAIGLMRAAELYEGSRGPFSSYAVLWIRARIRSFIFPTQKFGENFRLFTKARRLGRAEL